MSDQKNWFVVYTRPRWEKKISKLLDEKGIENYCPLNRVQKQWSDRKKIVFEPLFKGYVFIKVEDSVKWEVTNINGIINYVHWLGKPARVKNTEIESIKKFLCEFENVQIIDNEISVNFSVIINEGILMNYKGIVLEILGNKARIQIDSMGIKLCAVFDKSKISVSH